MRISVTVRYEMDGRELVTYTASRDVPFPIEDDEIAALAVGGLGLSLYLEAAANASEGLLDEATP